MASTTPFSLRLSKETKQRLKYEAAQEDRSETYIAAQAIEKELRARELKRQAIEAALEEAENGIFISSKSMNAWVDTWSTSEEGEAPEADFKATE